MDDLSTFIGGQLSRAERSDAVRDSFLKRYLGEKYGDEVEGRSEVITSEVFDVVESITAEIMDVLSSADRIVTFLPTEAQDEQRAEDETDACNAVFWDRNAGFENMQTWVKSGLIEQVGYIRSGWAEKRTVELVEYSEVPPEAVQQFAAAALQNPEIDDVRITAITGAADTPEGMVYQPTVSFKARIVRKRSVYEIEPIPQDRVLVTPRWRKQSLQDCPFVAVEDDTRSRSDLIAMGFHPEDVDALCDGDDEYEERFAAADNTEDGGEDEGSATVYECYALYDIDGDGIDERVRVWAGSKNGRVLRWADGSEAVEEVDQVPIYAWTPILVPHRHAGRGAAEITDDIQRQNTVLMRSLFDSVYSTLYPRPVVSSDGATPDTYDDLASPDHGAAIRVKTPDAVQWSRPPVIIGDLLPVLARMDSMKEERTGVSKLAQGLDKNTMTATATGQQVLLSQSQKRIKLITRNFAEYGLKDLFVGMHKDLRKGNMKSVVYRRGTAWQDENPVEWPPRQEMAVTVGTGNGDRAEQQQTLQMVYAAQKELVLSGSSLCTEAQLYETLDRAVKLGGFASAAPFFIDPNSEQGKQIAQAKAQQPKEPSPELLLAQAEMQKAQAQTQKSQADAQIAQANAQIAMTKAEREHELRIAEMQAQIQRLQTEGTKAGASIEQENQRIALEAQKLELDERYRRDKMALDANTAARATETQARATMTD